MLMILARFLQILDRLSPSRKKVWSRTAALAGLRQGELRGLEWDPTTRATESGDQGVRFGCR